MMGMSLCLGMYQTTRLDHKQMMKLKQLLKQSRITRHPELYDATTGFEGMETADNILKRDESVGVLIGSLAEGVWSQRRTKEQLADHKDVDVLVLTPNTSIGAFEGGIDWWIPKEEKIDLRTNISRIEGFRTKWWENGFNVVCPITTIVRKDLKPGLYIPCDDTVVDISERATSINISENRSIDYEVQEALSRAIRRRVHTRLPRFIYERFKGQILSDRYDPTKRLESAMDFDVHSHEMYVGICRHKKIDQ